MGPFTRNVSHLVSINEVHDNWESDHHQKSVLAPEDLIQDQVFGSSQKI